MEQHLVLNLTLDGFDPKFLNKNLFPLETGKLDSKTIDLNEIGFSPKTYTNLKDLEYLSSEQMQRLVDDVLETISYYYNDSVEHGIISSDNRISVIIPNDALFINHLAYKIGKNSYAYYHTFNMVIRRRNDLVNINW
mgnify:CR=1 FL=1